MSNFTYRLLSYLATEAGAEGYRLTAVLQLPADGVLILEREAEPSLERRPLRPRALGQSR